MYIVTAFALNYSTQNMGLPRELFLNIGLLVGGLLPDNFVLPGLPIVLVGAGFISQAR